MSQAYYQGYAILLELWEKYLELFRHTDESRYPGKYQFPFLLTDSFVTFCEKSNQNHLEDKNLL